MVPINPTPLVPHADDHTAPIHHDDVCRKEQNGERENESGDGLGNLTERISSPMAAPPRLENCQPASQGRHSVERICYAVYPSPRRKKK